MSSTARLNQLNQITRHRNSLFSDTIKRLLKAAILFDKKYLALNASCIQELHDMDSLLLLILSSLNRV